MTLSHRATIRARRRRCELLAGAAATLGMMAVLPTSVHAPIIQPPEEPVTALPEAAGGPIVVTGSRIVRDGNDAPTPVSVISSEEITTEAPANIADFVNTLPSVSGSQTATSNSGSLSNGASGISALNLRSLGQNRTLILVDGQRSVASTSTGMVHQHRSAGADRKGRSGDRRRLLGLRVGCGRGRGQLRSSTRTSRAWRPITSTA